MSNNTQPEIRFPGFTEDWEERKLNEGMTEYTDRVYIQDDEIYKQVSVKNVGEITLRGEQIGSKIGRKRQAKVNLIEHPDTLIFTRQTIEQGGIGFAPKETDGAIVTENMPTIDVDNDIINCNYLLAYVKTEDWYRKVILKNIEGGTAQIAIHEDSILSSEVLIPKIEEQQKIGTFFKQIDDTIALHQSKLDLLKETKKGFLQKMFPKNGAKVPEIRFPGFTEAWEQRKFFDNIKNTIDFRGRTPKKLGMDWSVSGYLALSALNVKNGYIDPSVDAHYGNQELYDKWMSGKELYKGQVLFTTEAPMGNVAQVPDNNKYILSQRTIAFELYSDKITDDFLAVLLRSPQSYNKLLSLASGGTAKGVSQKSLSQFIVTLPKDLDEQQKIGSFFKQLDDTIALHQRKLDLLKEMKKGFLQKMFV
ncbi:TPA: restriction endonuclease subunit S [Enterococcus faecium]